MNIQVHLSSLKKYLLSFPTICMIGLYSLLTYSAWGLGGTEPSVRLHILWGLSIIGLIYGIYLCIHRKPFTSYLPYTACIPIVWVLISTFFITPTPWLAKRECLLLLQGWIIFCIGFHNIDKDSLKLIAVFIIGLIFLQVGTALYQKCIQAYWLPMGYSVEVYSNRSTGTFTSPNHFSALLSFLFFPSFVMCFQPKMRFVAIVSILLCLVGLFLGLSRGALLGVFCCLLLFPIFFFKTPRSRYLFWFSTLIGCIVLRYTLYYYLDTFKAREHFIFSQMIDNTRLSFWKAAWQLFLEKPFIGQGSASFNILFEKYRQSGFLHQPIWVHNEYLNILADYGIIGLVAACIPLGIILKKLYQSIHSRIDNDKLLPLGLFLSLFSFCIHCFFDFNGHISTVFFIFCLYLAISYKITYPNLEPSTPAIPIGILLIIISLSILIQGTPLYKADIILKKNQTFLNFLTKEDKIHKTDTITFQNIDENLEKGLILDPNQADIWSLKSILNYYWYGQNPSETIATHCVEAAQKAIQVCPLHWLYWANYGLGLSLQQKPDNALGAIQTALELSPNNSMTWYYYALILNKDSSRPDKTLQALDRAISNNPKNHHALSLKDHILRTLDAQKIQLPPSPNL